MHIIGITYPFLAPQCVPNDELSLLNLRMDSINVVRVLQNNYQISISVIFINMYITTKVTN